MQDAPGESVTLDELTRALDLHMLRILVAIAETGSVSAAARRLGFSQPTITQPPPPHYYCIYKSTICS